MEYYLFFCCFFFVFLCVFMCVCMCVHVIIMSCRQHESPWPLSPPVSIVHRSREVFKAISCIGTELLYIGSSCSCCLYSSMWRGPQEYIAYEFVLTSSAVSCISGSSNLIVFVMDGRWPYSCCFVGFAFRTYSILLTAFLCNCRQAFSPYVYLASM